jgi:hypothetical protein
MAAFKCLRLATVAEKAEADERDVVAQNPPT